MNPDLIASPQEALCHLYFHCCFRDGKMTAGEIDAVSEQLVAAGLNRELNFKEEIVRYQSYRSEITDERAYINNLITHIHPTNELALFSFCVALCLSDGVLQAEEESLLHIIATALGIDDAAQQVCIRLMAQRHVVEREKVF